MSVIFFSLASFECGIRDGGGEGVDVLLDPGEIALDSVHISRVGGKGCLVANDGSGFEDVAPNAVGGAPDIGDALMQRFVAHVLGVVGHVVTSFLSFRIERIAASTNRDTAIRARTACRAFCSTTSSRPSLGRVTLDGASRAAAGVPVLDSAFKRQSDALMRMRRVRIERSTRLMP